MTPSLGNRSAIVQVSMWPLMHWRVKALGVAHPLQQQQKQQQQQQRRRRFSTRSVAGKLGTGIATGCQSAGSARLAIPTMPVCRASTIVRPTLPLKQAIDADGFIFDELLVWYHFAFPLCKDAFPQS